MGLAEEPSSLPSNSLLLIANTFLYFAVVEHYFGEKKRSRKGRRKLVRKCPWPRVAAAALV